MRLLALLVGFLLLSSLSALAGTPKAGPHLSAEALRALRPEHGPAWILEYEGEQGGLRWTETLTVAPDYVAVRTEGGTTIHDFRLGRIIMIDAEGRAFQNYSLAGMVHFHIQEAEHRRRMVAALRKDGISEAQLAEVKTFLDPWELSILPKGAAGADFAMVSDVRQVVATRAGEILAKAEFGPAVPRPVANTARKLWRWSHPVHPAFARAIDASQAVPAEVVLPHRDGPETLTLTGHRWDETTPYPLPQRAAVVDGGVSPDAVRTIALLRQAIADQVRPPPEAEYVARMEAALGSGKGLEAGLWAMEAMLAFGQPSERCRRQPSKACELMRQSLQAGGQDPRWAVLFGRGPLDKDTPLPDLSDVASAHVGTLLMTTRRVMGGAMGPDVDAGYLAAVRASPGVVNFYKDIGDRHLRQWEYPTGWLIYDLARALPAHGDGDMLMDIERMEDRLRRDFPDLF